MRPSRWFNGHPASVGETYAQHFIAAAGFGLNLVVAGLGCLIHAVIPEFFVHAGSNCVANLYDRLNSRRRAPEASSASARPPT